MILFTVLIVCSYLECFHLCIFLKFWRWWKKIMWGWFRSISLANRQVFDFFSLGWWQHSILRNYRQSPILPLFESVHFRRASGKLLYFYNVVNCDLIISLICCCFVINVDTGSLIWMWVWNMGYHPKLILNYILVVLIL